MVKTERDELDGEDIGERGKFAVVEDIEKRGKVADGGIEERGNADDGGIRGGKLADECFGNAGEITDGSFGEGVGDGDMLCRGEVADNGIVWRPEIGDGGIGWGPEVADGESDIVGDEHIGGKDEGCDSCTRRTTDRATGGRGELGDGD